MMENVPFNPAVAGLKLLQKPEVVFKKDPNIIDSPFQHSYALHAHAKC
jgi:hypothetical protein